MCKAMKQIVVLLILLLISNQTFSQTNKDTLSKEPLLIDDEGKEQDQIPTISIDENDNFTTTTPQSVSSVLNGSRDAFLSAASFNFSVARFRIRGYEQKNFSTYMNGVPMENLENGFSTWGLWSGLNDMTRSKEGTLGIKNTNFGFGELGGATNIDSRASKQRKQLSLSYATSNRTYNNRIILSYGSGFNKKGWAYALSIGSRWAEKAYIPGTDYQSFSYFGAIEKKIKGLHSLALTAFGAPTRNGRSTAAVQETFDITGSKYYNPNWGYQAGKIRNSSEGYTNQPVVILTHDYNINKTSNLITAISFSSGFRNITGLNWYNAPDPRPIYYRYLPSYFYAEKDTFQGKNIENMYGNNPELLQVQWDNMIDANRSQNNSTIQNANGITGNTVTGKRAVYIVENRIQKNTNFNFNSTYNKTFNDITNVSTGLTIQKQKSSFYKELVDLLGGDYFLDINQFAERDFRDSTSSVQNDLNNPNRIIKEGDRFGYNYDIYFNKNSFWGQLSHKFARFDFFITGELSNTKFWRDGKYKVGLFADNSLGKSEINNFLNYALKSGVTYKLNGRNYFFINGFNATKAPNYFDVFMSLRTRNDQIINPPSEKISSIEGGYIYNSPLLKLRNNYYYTTFRNGIHNNLYFDDVYAAFGNLSVSNINKIHYGTELSLEGKLYKGLSFTSVAAIGRNYFSTRQTSTFTVDNTAKIFPSELVYVKNYRVGGTPEQAYNVGLNYRSKKFWWMNLNINNFRNAWENISPARRTSAAIDLVQEGSAQWNEIVDQKKLYSSQYTVDFSAGYSIKLNKVFMKLKNNHFLVLNANVNNLLDNQNLKTTGYEQLRFDITNHNPNKFPSRYNYAFGRNYFISITYRF
jgi:hypothetical protein